MRLNPLVTMLLLTAPTVAVPHAMSEWEDLFHPHPKERLSLSPDGFDPFAARAARNRFETRLGPVIKRAQGTLVPGGKVVQTIALQAGELLIASASGADFNVRILLLDENRKQVAANEDREPNDPAPLILVQAKTSGEYQLVADARAPHAGGPTTLSWTVFKTCASQLLPDRKTYRILPVEPRTGPIAVRFDLERGDILQYAETPFQVSVLSLSSEEYFWFGPTGVNHLDFAVLPGVGRHLVLARRTGTYFRIRWNQIEPITAYRLRPTVATAIPNTQFDLAPAEARVFVVPAQTGQAFRTTATGSRGAVGTVSTLLDNGPAQIVNSSTSEGWGYRYGHFWIQMNDKSSRDQVRLMDRPGMLYFVVRSQTDQPQRVFLTTERLPEWRDGETQAVQLGFGDTRCFRLSGPSERLERWTLDSPGLVPSLYLLRYAIVGSTSISTEGRTHWIAFFPEGGESVLRVSSQNLGGAGEIRMRREILLPARLLVGVSVPLEGRKGLTGYFRLDPPSAKEWGITTDPDTLLRALEPNGHPIHMTAENVGGYLHWTFPLVPASPVQLLAASTSGRRGSLILTRN